MKFQIRFKLIAGGLIHHLVSFCKILISRPLQRTTAPGFNIQERLENTRQLRGSEIEPTFSRVIIRPGDRQRSG